MILSISSFVLTRQLNIGLGKPRSLNTSNLDRTETMMRAATFALVIWSWWGKSFSFDWIRMCLVNVFRSDVAQFFQPSINCIVKAVLEQKNNAHKPISVSFYIPSFIYHFQTNFGIFSMSSLWAGLLQATGYSPKYMNYLLPLDWTSFVLKTTCECSWRLKRRYYSKKISRSKAVSDGAISFYLDHFVRTRVSKVAYGNFCHIAYNPYAPDHRLRSHKVFISVSGEKRINDSFNIILPKVILNLLKSMFFKNF